MPHKSHRHNGEVPLIRTKPETEPVPIKPKTPVVDSGEKNSEAGKMFFAGFGFQ